MLPEAVTLTVIGVDAGVFSSGFCTPGRRTCAPACIAGITTMKMMSSTSTTSTSGVTLMSGVARLGRRTDLLSVALAVKRARYRVLRLGVLQVVDQLALGLLERLEEVVGARVEEVEGEHRRDGDDEAEGGDHQRLGDTGRDGAQTARALGGDALEGGDDADDGAEEADEGSDRAHRGQHAHAAPQVGRDRLRLALELATGELDGRELARLLRVADEGPHPGGEQPRQMAGVVL